MGLMKNFCSTKVSQNVSLDLISRLALLPGVLFFSHVDQYFFPQVHIGSIFFENVVKLDWFIGLKMSRIVGSQNLTRPFFFSVIVTIFSVKSVQVDIFSEIFYRYNMGLKCSFRRDMSAPGLPRDHFFQSR